jgi:hypothetical protein
VVLALTVLSGLLATAPATAEVTDVTLGVNKPSPQRMGTPLTFTAVGTGVGGSGAEYQFWLARTGGLFRMVKDYAAPGNTWAPGPGDMDAADSYVVTVCARNKGSIAPYERLATKDYVMLAYAPVRTVTLNADTPSPQDIATIGTVTFTAAAAPGVPGAAVEYRFWLYSNASGAYTAVGDATTGYAAANTWHWTPTVKDDYKVMAYARTVGGTVAYEKLKVVFFTVYAFSPTLGDVTPAVLAGPSGSAQTLSAVYSDSEGFEGLKTAGILLNETASAANGIFARYDRSLGKLYLVNDAGTAYVGNCAPGSAGTLTNSQGSLNCQPTTVDGSGNDLTIGWSITPKIAFTSTTPKNIYTHVKDNSNVQVGWVDKGDWTITNEFDSSDCEGCHGKDCKVGMGADGLAGTADDAPNVMTTECDGLTGVSVWDGSWWDTVRGGNNATQQGGHGDPDGTEGGNAALTPTCLSCHSTADPPGTHLDGVYNSLGTEIPLPFAPWNRAAPRPTANRNTNTAHLLPAYFTRYPGGAGDSALQVTMDNYCYRECHAANSVNFMGHDADLPVGDPDYGPVLLGTHLTRTTPTSFNTVPAWPITPLIDSDITTSAAGLPNYAPCISCHNPHGTMATDTVRSASPTDGTNRMIIDNWRISFSLCKDCHVVDSGPEPPTSQH